MATSFFYFSGTGNSFWIARQLAQMLRPSVVVSMPVALQSGAPTTSEAVGFVFPVYMFGLPVIVERFASQVSLAPGTYIFAVATHGGAPGGALLYLERILRTRGLPLNAGFAVRMPGNYTPLYGAPSPAKQKKILDTAAEGIAHIAEAVKHRRAVGFNTVSGVPGFLFTRWIRPAAARRIPQQDRRFWVLPVCDGCGLCSRICPVGNIRMEADRPHWSHRCEQCMACLQWCPREAIQLGKTTVGRRRYHHPEVRASDLVSGLQIGRES
ncbi:MAG: EFR1 family ferrodoxin [Kiritimatiellia bacterium]